MHHHSFILPLAQMHATSTAPATGAPVAAPSAPVADSTTATTSTGSTGATATTGQPTTQEIPHSSSAGNMIQFGIIALIFVGFYLFMFRGQKKTEKTRKQMLEAMKKGDEVMTIGGLVARVQSIDDDEIVLKIDESANVKARFKKSAIQQVLTADDKAK